ncbi:MAG TPA: hypothetical protein VN456_05705 [Desulfosporosinus sp.]|nr:hypothetical protein [Desulfosporosinus sp.]
MQWEDQGNQSRQDNEAGKETSGTKDHDFDKGSSSFGKGSLDPKEQALSNIAIKMLNDRSA